MVTFWRGQWRFGKSEIRQSRCDMATSSVWPALSRHWHQSTSCEWFCSARHTVATAATIASHRRAAVIRCRLVLRLWGGSWRTTTTLKSRSPLCRDIASTTRSETELPRPRSPTEVQKRLGWVSKTVCVRVCVCSYHGRVSLCVVRDNCQHYEIFADVNYNCMIGTRSRLVGLRYV